MSRITQSFAFHQAPESFIFDRLQRSVADGARDDNNGPPAVTAQILNRNVHIVSSYRQCKAILTSDSTDPDSVDDQNGDAVRRIPAASFAAGPAYHQLMAAFFPPPTLLLQDGQVHHENKQRWKGSFTSLADASKPLIRQLTLEAFGERSKAFVRNRQFDLYEALKSLAWDLLLGIFLGLNRSSNKDGFGEMESLQEDLLRGQFSLFPVALKMPFFKSARSVGLRAVKDLEPAIEKSLQMQKEASARVDGNVTSCPFARATKPGNSNISQEETVSHLRLFTSSIANKALASLLTAYFLNMFLWRDPHDQGHNRSLAGLVSSQDDSNVRRRMLSSVLHETARLSPPVIGVMRRAMQTVRLGEGSESQGAHSHNIPTGHDAWLYFAAANRDASVFHQPNDFCWDRFMSDDASEHLGLAFGAGPKQCLGTELTHDICLTVMETVLDSGLVIEGKVEEAGIREWLGWQHSASPEAMAKDLKQLPCQRPRRPVIASLRKSSDLSK